LQAERLVAQLGMIKALTRPLSLILYYGFAYWLPSSSSPGGALWKTIRYLLCRQLFAGCGRGVNVECGARFHSGSRIVIGNRSGIGERAVLNGTVLIGDNVMMGPEVVVYSRDHEFVRTDIPMNQQGFEEERAVRIGDDVWIGGRVILLHGVCIGTGAVIGAGTVVTKDVPSWAVVAGNPARIIRSRKPGAPAMRDDALQAVAVMNDEV
jgi:maltose O-acetyltransferase